MIVQAENAVKECTYLGILRTSYETTTDWCMYAILCMHIGILQCCVSTRKALFVNLSDVRELTEQEQGHQYTKWCLFNWRSSLMFIADNKFPFAVDTYLGFLVQTVQKVKNDIKPKLLLLCLTTYMGLQESCGWCKDAVHIFSFGQYDLRQRSLRKISWNIACWTEIASACDQPQSSFHIMCLCSAAIIPRLAIDCNASRVPHISSFNLSDD